MVNLDMSGENLAEVQHNVETPNKVVVGTSIKALPQVIDSTESVGVFPNPDDVALVGRKNTDIVLGMSYKLPQPEDRPKEQQVDFAELQERIRQQQLACHNQ